MPPPLPVRVVVGVDGSGRTRRLRAAAEGTHVWLPRHAGAEPTRDLIDGAGGSLLLLDDAHARSPDVLAVVAAAVAAGGRLALSRRPGTVSAALADLEDAVLETGVLVTLPPLGPDDVSRALSEAGSAAGADDVDRVVTLSGGAAWVVSGLAEGGPAPPEDTGWPTLRAATERRLARLLPGALELVALLAVTATLASPPDERVLSAALAAAAVDGDEAPDTSPPGGGAPWRDLQLAGMLDGTAAGSGRLVPAVAQIVHEAMTAAERRGCLGRLAAGMRATAADDLVVAAGALAQTSDSVDPVLATANGWALQSRTDRVAAGLEGSALSLHRSLAVPALVATGRDDRAAALLAGLTDAPVDAALLLARAVAAIAGRPPQDVLPGLIGAAEVFETRSVSAAVPRTPHEVAAVVAVAAGDQATGDRLLVMATAVDAGGPTARLRHRLLAAWVRLRSGRGDPMALLRELAGRPLAPRDAMVVTVLLAGSARRRSDISALRACWDQVAQQLARRCVDLFELEMAEELVLAAARLDQRRRAAGVLADLAAMAPPGVAAWQSGLAWLELQIAVVADDADAAAAAVKHATAAAGLSTAGPRQRAQAGAVAAWADAVAGRVDPDAVLGAVEALVGDAELPWEGGRLAGAAALRTTDPRAARRLLERARELSWAAEPRAPGTGGPVAAGAVTDGSGVSERELEVAQLVLAGRTHREIGSQLFISPKTVEHHVARIRTKVGARDRAEFMSALRALVAGTS